MRVLLATAVIPAYNEQATVGDIVSVIKQSPYIEQVLVISDGSKDKTAEIARGAGAKVVELKRRAGKGNAMLESLKHTVASVLVFFDADLRGLTTEHVERLVLPVLHGARVMNVGIRDRGEFWTRASHHLPLISGERAVKRSVIESVPKEFMQGFMIETSLNYFCRIERLPYGAVNLKGLSIRTKFEKVGYALGVVQYITMTVEVLKAILAVRLARLFGGF